MGHTRLGRIPKTRKWKAVVAQIAGGPGSSGISLAADVADVAAQTLDAAQKGLRKATEDIGLRYTVYLLTQIVLAARTDAWLSSLKHLGIEITPQSNLFDLASEAQYVIDDFLSTHGGSTDISEMAQQAAGEALLTLASSQSMTLFGDGDQALQSAVRQLSTTKGFSNLGQLFFGRFLYRYLNFYLSRVTAAELGNDRITSIDEQSVFNSSLRLHCEQTAQIVRSFCGDWYSKTEFQRGIDLENTGGFVAHAMNKLHSELVQQGAEI